MTAPIRTRPETLVDLDRYPLFDPAGRADLLATGRRSLAEQGAAVLPGFLKPDAVAVLAAEAMSQMPVAHRRDRMLRADGREPEAWMAADHPMRRPAPTGCGCWRPTRWTRPGRHWCSTSGTR